MGKIIFSKERVRRQAGKRKNEQYFPLYKKVLYGNQRNEREEYVPSDKDVSWPVTSFQFNQSGERTTKDLFHRIFSWYFIFNFVAFKGGPFVINFITANHEVRCLPSSPPPATLAAAFAPALGRPARRLAKFLHGPGPSSVETGS
jgi:hypothetical protein